MLLKKVCNVETNKDSVTSAKFEICTFNKKFSVSIYHNKNIKSR